VSAVGGDSDKSVRENAVFSLEELREYVKALIDRLEEDQLEALSVLLEYLAFPVVELDPEEARELDEALAEVRKGNFVRAEDVWKELGI
jgi:DNA-directed RNA polymerase subunit F